MSDRLHGLDYIRLVSFFAIATFHVSLIHYSTPAIDIAEQSLVIKATEQISRVLAFSGFTICFLSSLLTAFSGSNLQKRIRLFAFLFVGWTAFSALMSAPEDTWLVWDIYPLIFVGILLCSMIQLGSERVLKWAGIIGFCMLWIPFWDFGAFLNLPATLQTTLGFSSCDGDVVEWPVFPWIGLVFFGYWIGNEARHRWKSGRGFFQLSKKEGAFWGVALAATTLEFGNFYGIRLGHAFACEAYRQPPLIWWSHFLWPVFLIRASFDPRVQDWLGSFRLSRFVSNLAINRKFWLAYFANYLFCYVLSMLVTWSDVEKTEWNTTVIAFIAVFLVPMTEGLTRAIIWAATAVAPLVRKLPPGAALNPARSDRGASLMAVLIASAVIGGMVGGITLMVRSRTDARMLRNAINGKEYAFELLRQSAASPDALKMSALPKYAAENPGLNECINGPIGGPKSCTNTNGALQALTLRVPFTAKAAPIPVTAANSGVMDAHYNWRGLRQPCNPSETCLYWATAWWTAICADGDASCARAESIIVIPQLVPFSKAKLKGHVTATTDLASMPRTEQITKEKSAIAAGKPLRFGVQVRVTDINSTQMQQCPSGSFMSGTQANGTISCSCAHGYVLTGTYLDTNWPKCKPLASCKTPLILSGIDEEGKAYCYDPKGTTFNCDDKRVGSNGTINCPSGSRMREVSVKSECEIKTDDGEYVDCGDMEIKCCKAN